MISRKALPEHVRLGLKATTPSGDFVVSSMLFNIHERGVRVCIYIYIYVITPWILIFIFPSLLMSFYRVLKHFSELVGLFLAFDFYLQPHLYLTDPVYCALKKKIH